MPETYIITTIQGFDASKFNWKSNDSWSDRAEWGGRDCIVQIMGDTRCEIVADMPDRYIYQDVNTVANAKYIWSLDHASTKNGFQDVMQVIINGSPQSATCNRASRDGDPNGSIWAYQSYQQRTGDSTLIMTPGSWDTGYELKSRGYTGSWISPSYDQATRFTFRSVVASSKIDGNIVDNIGFSVFNPSVSLSYSTTNNRDGGTAKITSSGSSIASDGLSCKAGWNKNVGITITPNTGYHIQSITVDGVSRTATQNLVLSNCQEDHDVKVVFAPNEYTVRYNTVIDNEFGAATTGTTPSSAHVYDASKNLTTNGYVREGFTFKGWGTASSKETLAYSNTQEVINLTATNGAIIDLYAIWEPIYVTVEYRFDGEILPFTERIQYGTKFSPASQATTLATRENCDGFYGWYTKNDYTGQWINGTRLKQNTVFYGRNAVHLDFKPTDRTYDQVDAELLYTDETTAIVVDRDILDDATPIAINGKWYGDTVSIASSIASAPPFWSTAAEITHVNPCMGGWTNPKATGTRNETFTLTGNRTVYIDWAATGAYDGARSNWGE